MSAAIEMDATATSVAGSPKPRAPREKVNIGVLMSVAFHAVLIGYLLYLVHPHVSFMEPKKVMATVELAPPPPPPPPPPPKEPPPKTPPKLNTPPPPQQIVTQAAVPTPDLPTVPPPPAEVIPSPPPPPARVVGTTVPAAYYNGLEALIQKSVQYPKKSIEEQEEGNCMVRVTFSRDGTIEDEQLINKAGFPMLDSECKGVFKRIGKFPAIPADANPDATDFAIELPITFALQ